MEKRKNRELSEQEKEKKRKEDEIFSWFLSSTTVVAIIISIYLMKRPELIHPNKNRNNIELNSYECKKKILELTKENDSLKKVIYILEK